MNIKEAELRITGRIQASEEQIERLFSRISSFETKMDIESCRISKNNSDSHNSFEAICNLTNKIKAQQDIIDEMRRVIFTRVGKVEANIKQLNNNKRSTLVVSNTNEYNKVGSYKNMNNIKRNSSRIKLEDNFDHSQYIDQIENTPITTKNEYRIPEDSLTNK